MSTHLIPSSIVAESGIVADPMESFDMKVNLRSPSCQGDGWQGGDGSAIGRGERCVSGGVPLQRAAGQPELTPLKFADEALPEAVRIHCYAGIVLLP